jgi:nicotinamidase-related amidase
VTILASNAALLIVDMQRGFDDPSWGWRNNPGLEERVAELVVDTRTVLAATRAPRSSVPLRKSS